jgi:replicative DNA helicase
MTAYADPIAQSAEENCLAVALLNRAAARIVAQGLIPGDFYRPAHREVFERIQELVAQHRDVDPLLVAEGLNSSAAFRGAGGLKWLHSLMALPAYAGNVREYVRIVAEQARAREAKQIARRLLEGDMTLDEAEPLLKRSRARKGPRTEAKPWKLCPLK